MVTVDQLRVSNIIPVVVSEILLNEFPLCGVCGESFDEGGLILILRGKNRVLSAFHKSSIKRDCEMRFKGLFIQSHREIAKEELCVILNLSRRHFFRIKGRQW